MVAFARTGMVDVARTVVGPVVGAGMVPDADILGVVSCVRIVRQVWVLSQCTITFLNFGAPIPLLERHPRDLVPLGRISTSSGKR
eukprot:scaffold29095_cov30-Attheya_sp.AAC.1